jgi:hypothetical protein
MMNDDFKKDALRTKFWTAQRMFLALSMYKRILNVLLFACSEPTKLSFFPVTF